MGWAARHPASRFYQPLWVSGFGFWGLDFGFQVSDFGLLGGFSFQIPNAIDKLKIGALQRANFKLVNCLNDWLRVDAGGSGGLAPQLIWVI